MLRLGLAVLFLLCGVSAQAAKFPDAQYDVPYATTPGEETIVLAGGCFWGMQAVFEHVRGVKQVLAGYAGGTADTAHYEQVSTGETGHAEAVKVTFDPSQVTLGEILKVYFSVAHNPLSLNYQGPDHGTQYRSTIFYTSPQQKKFAQDYITQLNGEQIFPTKIATSLEPLKGFYAAEDYHQDYLKKHPYNPYILVNDAPKLEKLKAQWPDLYVE